VQASPLDPDAYRALAEVALMASDVDTRFLAVSALSFVNASRPDEEQFLAERVARIHFRPTATLEPAVLEQRLAPPEAQGVLRELWRELGEAVARAFASTVETLGLTRTDRVSSRLAAPLATEWQRIGGAFGVGEAELYFWSREAARIQAVAASGGVVLVGRDVSAPLVAAHRFEAGRAAALLRDRLVVALAMQPAELELVIAAGVRQVVSGFGSWLETGQLEDRTRRLGKALGRRERKAIGGLAESLARLPAASFQTTVAAWRRGVQRLGNRAGLLVAGDLNAVLEGVVPGLPPPATRRFQPQQEVLRRLRDNDDVADVLVFALGAEFSRLRRDLGLAMG
jgi:hypothetical protein